MSYNTTTAAFSLCYNLTGSAEDSAASPSSESVWAGPPAPAPLSLTTEIYFNAATRYPNGADVVTTTNVVATVQGNMVYVVPAGAGARGTACVSITAK